MGLDETKFLAATRTHRTQYVTGFVDLDRARLLDVVPGRSGQAVRGWLDGRPAGWLAGIDVVALDPFRGYANGLLGHLGHATVVIDHFHAVRLANAAIDDVRRRVQNQTLGHRGRTGDPLYGIRRLVLVAHERLDPRGWNRMMAGLAAGDPDGEVGAAVLAKELLRETYAAVDLRHARHRLTVFYQWCAEAEVPELARLATTISASQQEVLAYHTARQSNGPTEAVILWSGQDGVFDVLDGGDCARGGRVPWSVSSVSTMSRAACARQRSPVARTLAGRPDGGGW